MVLKDQVLCKKYNIRVKIKYFNQLINPNRKNYKKLLIINTLSKENNKTKFVTYSKYIFILIQRTI